MPVKPIERRTAEDRARMRAHEKRYLQTHPDQMRKKVDRLNERYATEPEFRQKMLDRARLYREKKRLARIQVESEPEQTTS